MAWLQLDYTSLLVPRQLLTGSHVVICAKNDCISHPTTFVVSVAFMSVGLQSVYV